MSICHGIRRWVFAALLVGAALPAHAVAQLCTSPLFSTVSVSPPMISFSTPTFVDFDNGAIIYQTTATVNVNLGSGNRPWDMCVQTLSPDLGTSSGVTKPVTELEWQTGGGAWMPASFTPQLIGSGRGDGLVQFNLRMRLSWDADPPGTYGTILQFTVAR
ncbi:MAG: hypothetical protein ACREKM_07245 [Longimicrobiales bacterium]